MKVALVHDWLTGMRGGEKVLLSLCRLFPEAPIFTLLHLKGTVDPEIEAHPTRTSCDQHPSPAPPPPPPPGPAPAPTCRVWKSPPVRTCRSPPPPPRASTFPASISSSP